MLFLRRTLPMILAFVTGIIGISIYYVPHSSAQGLEEVLARWLRIVYAFAFFLGLFSLLNLHWRRVRARQAGWGYSLIVYLSFGLMIFFVLYNDGTGPFSPQARAVDTSGSSSMYRFPAAPPCSRFWRFSFLRRRTAPFGRARRRRPSCWLRR